MQKTRFTLFNLFVKGKVARFVSLMSLIVVFSFITLLLRAENEEKQGIDEKFTNSLQYQPISIDDFDIGDEYVFEQIGKASWYGNRFHNKKTANGERYNKNKLSAAHKKLPFGTILKVTDEETGNMTFVRINDRGPFVKNRVIDLSLEAVETLGGNCRSKVKLEGILRRNILNSREFDEPFALAYSFDEDVACVPAKVFNILDSTNDFHDAVEIYKKMREEHTDFSVFLIEPLNYALDDKDEQAGLFYVGFFQPDRHSLVKDLIIKSIY